jgi:hypothetical protein
VTGWRDNFVETNPGFRAWAGGLDADSDYEFPDHRTWRSDDGATVTVFDRDHLCSVTASKPWAYPGTSLGWLHSLLNQRPDSRGGGS